jgi:hypothetical protein
VRRWRSFAYSYNKSIETLHHPKGVGGVSIDMPRGGVFRSSTHLDNLIY